eukprot:Blabericola_migrator_1__856@NODE_120_length_13560_cov_140_919884_g26_i1_p10_GENE_NODE_120_length_13560_cov_140_919884_g26_i1NODE_120_length_13560_cov_140_919884_g26_i1_p10_ORF_typecomplete_len166_score25_56RRP36/PF06102_12/6_2e12ERp29/PF07749_12/1_1e02ERp29/PF07749_12/0_3ERp29/PF07749_12/7e02_NODE_120_length_13560_cov_140_919884_g26_i116302127
MTKITIKTLATLARQSNSIRRTDDDYLVRELESLTKVKTTNGKSMKSERGLVASDRPVPAPNATLYKPKTDPIDPRFRPIANEQKPSRGAAATNRYQFLDDIRQREIEQVRAALSSGKLSGEKQDDLKLRLQKLLSQESIRKQITLKGQKKRQESRRQWKERKRL